MTRIGARATRFLGVWGVAGAAALTSWASPALADIKQECSAAYEQTQAARKEGKLRVAREKVITCSQEACPGFVKTDCGQWLTEIESSLPTVVFEVRDASGGETSEVRVLFDGQLLKERLDGKAVPVDPGEHTIRYEMAGAEPKEERIVVREGEKNRKLSVSFAQGTTSPVGPAGATADVGTADGGAPVLAYVLGGVGVVGIGLFATFGILGTSEKSDLEDPATGCAPNCSDDQVNGIRSKLIVADISLGVGVVALGVATYLFLTAPPAAASASAGRSRLSVSAWPTERGAMGSVRGTF